MQVLDRQGNPVDRERRREVGPLTAVEDLQLLAGLVRDVQRERESGRGIHVQVLPGRRLGQIAACAKSTVQGHRAFRAWHAPRHLRLRAPGAERAQRRERDPDPGAAAHRGP
jgi:hypothetical protein